MKTLICLLFLFFWVQPVHGYDKLFSRHCKAANVPKDIAMAIARQESGLNPNCVNVEGEDYFPDDRSDAEKIVRKAEAEKKSYDVGLMQINSQWIRKWKLDPCSLLDPDTNIRTGVRILSDEIKRHGLNWKAVGAYHSPNPARAMHYAGQVFGRMKGKSASGLIPNPRLQVLVDRGIITRAEARSILANPRLNGNYARSRLKAMKSSLFPRKKSAATRSALAEYMRTRKGSSED